MDTDLYTRQTENARDAGRAILGLPTRLGPLQTNRLIFAVILFALAAAPGMLGEVTRGSLEDAYVGVSVFVAVTLFLFYGAEALFGINLANVFRNAKLTQVPLAAMMGALPGCGGAVVVVAAYSSGSVTMGSVVAALTATMGDAAFLLIAKRPDAAIVLLPLSFVVGVASGYIVDLVDKRKYGVSDKTLKVHEIGHVRKRDMAYCALIVPGFVFGIMALAQMEPMGLLATTITAISLVGIALGIIIWVASPLKALTNDKDPAITRVAEETSFITSWVILAFLMFEYLHNFAGLDLEAMFATVGVALPLIAILVGFIPGCGPQILVTTFYINGLVPFSALIGNAIANDGDALFPAIALNPKAAFVATIYSAIPAFFVAYGLYFFAPNLLN